MYTHCTHVQQVQLMRLSRVVLACTTWRQPGLSLARWTLVLASQVVCFLFVCVFITFLGGGGGCLDAFQYKGLGLGQSGTVK
jgi:hypothetical protein